MKKATTILLALVMVLSLAACGDSTEELKEELRGAWVYDYYSSYHGVYYHDKYTFIKDGTVKREWIVDGAPDRYSCHEGTYSIEEDKIVLTLDYDAFQDNIEMEYSYTDGNLRLFYNGPYEDGEVELKKD